MNKGFTVLELLITILWIFVLFLIAIPVFSEKDKTQNTDIDSISVYSDD